MADLKRSFIASLNCNSGDGDYPVGCLREGDRQDGSGWIIQQEKGNRSHTSAEFRFDFIKEEGSRIYYNITATPDTYGGSAEGSKLGVSLNGYLGLYHFASVTDPWKVELEGENSKPHSFNFILRDARGYRVGCVKHTTQNILEKIVPWVDPTSPVRFLNVEEGDIVHFTARIKRYV